jgi:excisionase family DNA binding protein
VSVREHIRALAEALPADGAAMVPVAWLRELVAGNGLQTSAKPVADLTVAELARLFGRKPSSVRGWLEAGLLEGYKLNGREWRVTPAAVEAFQDRQRDGKRSEGSVAGDRPAGGLRDWRNVRRGGAP